MSTIIIVDDQPVNRSIYAKIAASIGEDVNVETFSDPRKALDAVLKKTPDLIITDYKMPGMNGATFIRRLRAEPALIDVPTIVITVYDEKAYRLRALDAGATDFLLSPVDHREFVTRARNLLKLRKQQLLLADRAQTLEHKLEHSERNLEQAVRDSSERLGQVIDAVPALISATDQNGRFLFANDFYANLIGTNPASMIGRDPVEVFGEEGAARLKALDHLVIQNGRPIHSYEEEITDQAGAKRYFFTNKSPLKNATDETIGVVTSSLEITDRKAAEQHLQHLAHHDQLTGLPNRTLLSERMHQEIARARRGDRRFALHVIDFDEFKSVNDALGHSTGDKLLIAMAERLHTIESKGFFVSRLGGDEFAILQTELQNSETAAVLADEIRRLIREPMQVGGERVATTASIGIAVHPLDGDSIEDLLRHADIAMYKAKGDGGDQYRFYAADMNVRASQAMALDAELRDAIERQEFELHYQPQIKLATGEVMGAEALIRWRKRDGTLVPPSGFLPRAEENGMILAINDWVLREACRQAAEWRNTGMPKLRTSVNLSPIQFRRHSLPLFVTKILNETGLDARLLELELTENFLMQDIDQVAHQLQQLRELGVVISIDDFGTGFSSLSYVKRLPVDRLKIDQSFVRDLMSDPSDRAIVAAIVNLAHSLNMEVVAEGVETSEQLALVRAAGCDGVQGFYYGRPMPAAEFRSFVAPNRRLAGVG
jgi:diguanylate cyclase (GGDEF)-like protein/PAS domain S-box-containing protein